MTPPKPAKNVETRITSDQLTYLAEKQLVIFDKNVHVVRPDIEIWADRITVYLKPPKGDAQKKEGEKGGMPAGMAAGDVDRIVAERNVRMKSENRNGTCAKATYTMNDGVLLMEGDPRLTDGEKHRYRGNHQVLYGRKPQRSHGRVQEARRSCLFRL
ncbi:LptA/OstA family protein [Bilophila wadsworthia]|uniref:LptA/OstA family protein n=1 Tax=Bilophila wadsworthia TaxID=35833 RepID=UPI0035216A9A